MKTLKDFSSAYRVAVKGIVLDGQERLLLVKERGFWDLPGGGLEHGETPIAALQREFDEELNVQADVEARPLQIVNTWNNKFNNPVLLLLYRSELGGEPSLTTEVTEYRFVGKDELQGLELDSTLTADFLRSLA